MFDIDVINDLDPNDSLTFAAMDGSSRFLFDKEKSKREEEKKKRFRRQHQFTSDAKEKENRTCVKTQIGFIVTIDDDVFICQCDLHRVFFFLFTRSFTFTYRSDCE